MSNTHTPITTARFEANQKISRDLLQLRLRIEEAFDAEPTGPRKEYYREAIEHAKLTEWLFNTGLRGDI